MKRRLDLPRVVTFKISADPTEFRHQDVYNGILHIICAANANGGLINSRSVCRCSYFPLDNLIELAMRGELFAGINGANPELLAYKLIG